MSAPIACGCQAFPFDRPASSSRRRVSAREICCAETRQEANQSQQFGQRLFIRSPLDRIKIIIIARRLCWRTSAPLQVSWSGASICFAAPKLVPRQRRPLRRRAPPPPRHDRPSKSAPLSSIISSAATAPPTTMARRSARDDLSTIGAQFRLIRPSGCCASPSDAVAAPQTATRVRARERERERERERANQQVVAAVSGCVETGAAQLIPSARRVAFVTRSADRVPLLLVLRACVAPKFDSSEFRLIFNSGRCSQAAAAQNC